MKNQLVDIFLKESGAFKPFIVGIDNKKEMNEIYKKLNEVTLNNWTYCIDELISDDMSYRCSISLFVPGRVMTGFGYSRDLPEKAIEEAIRQSVSMLYPCSEKEDADNIEKIKDIVKEETPVFEELESIKPLEEALTFDEIDEQGLDNTSEIDNEVKEDDNELAMEGNTITKGQVRFINEFKEANQIDDDEKFNYYIKTWASNVAIDGIDNKIELIQSGHDILDNFIKWIKVMQPTLDKGIVSPI